MAGLSLARKRASAPVVSSRQLYLIKTRLRDK